MTEIHDATLELAKALIARRSVTPDDAGCVDLIAARLDAAGFACERIDRGGVANLWARHGTARPLVCLAGHVDVVPSGPVEAWTSDPFEPAERGGGLYGRGAADMKGAVAAMVTALERIAADRPDHAGSLAILLTSDEEGAADDGTKAVVDVLRARGETIDACLIGEPTSVARLGDTIKHGRRGSLNGVLTLRGVQGHVAYPDRARNPIHAALPALTELVAAVWDRGDDQFPPTAFQISNVHAGTGATNVIPGSMTIQFNIRFTPASTAENLQHRVRHVLDRHGLEYDLAWTLSGEPFVTGRGPLIDTLRAVIHDVTGLTPALSTSGGTSDGRFLAAIARETVEFGPLGDSIHKVNERIALADLAPLSVIYERAATALLAPPA
jgi:succinyl-diaminopimelate desuccinylase